MLVLCKGRIEIIDTMSAATDIIKSVGPKLVPFFKALAIYFVVFIPASQPSILSAILKCLPIVSLIFFVYLHGRNLDDEHKWFAKKILLGLIFSCIGDACLVWEEYFTLGMLAFAVGHVNYTIAFGFDPLNFKFGAILYLVSILPTLYLLSSLHGILKVAVPIYSAMITTMAWRAASRLNSEEGWSWSKLFAALGAFTFLLSDAILAFNYFKHSIPHSQVLIMTTYYAAQLGIALSVVDPRARKIRTN